MTCKTNYIQLIGWKIAALFPCFYIIFCPLFSTVPESPLSIFFFFGEGGKVTVICCILHFVFWLFVPHPVSLSSLHLSPSLSFFPVRSSFLTYPLSYHSSFLFSLALAAFLCLLFSLYPVFILSFLSVLSSPLLFPHGGICMADQRQQLSLCHSPEMRLRKGQVQRDDCCGTRVHACQGILKKTFLMKDGRLLQWNSENTDNYM